MQKEHQALQEEANFHRILWALKRRPFVLLGGFLVGLGLSLIFITQVPPNYKASAQLLFDPSVEQITDPSQNSVTSLLTLRALDRAIAIIQSPGVLKEVALRIVSPEKPMEFTSWIEKILKDVSLDEDTKVRRLIKGLERNLTVKTEAADQIIGVEYQSKSPQEAAFLSNLIAQTFIEVRTGARKDTIKQATDWLDQRVAEAKDKLISVDKTIQDYKAENKIDNDSGSNSFETQLSHLREQLAILQGKKADAEAFYKALSRDDGRSAWTSQSRDEPRAGWAPDHGNLADNLNDPGLDKLRSSLVEAEGQLAAAKASLGASHPAVQAKQVQVLTLKREIETAARRKLQSNKKELESFANEEKELKSNIDFTEKRLYGLRAAEVHLRELQRERDAIKTQYESTLTKLTSTAPQQAATSSDFKMLMSAVAPDQPKMPPLVILVGGCLVGFLLGVGVSFALEYFGDELVHLDDIEKKVPINVIAYVPTITEGDFRPRGQGKKNKAAARYLQYASDYPQSLFTNCLLSAKLSMAEVAGGQAKLIMITSPMKGNGKTHISRNLASLSSLLGEKTLLIDLDFRKELSKEVSGEVQAVAGNEKEQAAAGNGEAQAVAANEEEQAVAGNEEEQAVTGNEDEQAVACNGEEQAVADNEEVQTVSANEAEELRSGTVLDASSNSDFPLPMRREGDFDVIRPMISDKVAWLNLFQPQMRKLLECARRDYDQVWIDTPPVQVFADALVLARQVDGIVIVAEWSKTTKRQLRETRKLILRSGGKILGVLVNNIRVDRLVSQSMASYASYYASQHKQEPLRRRAS